MKALSVEERLGMSLQGIRREQQLLAKHNEQLKKERNSRKMQVMIQISRNQIRESRRIMRST